MIVLEARSAREGGALNFTVELFPRLEALLRHNGHDVHLAVGPPKTMGERLARRWAYTKASAILHAGNRATLSLGARRIICVRDRLLLEKELPAVSDTRRFRVRKRLLALGLRAADVAVVPSRSMIAPLDEFRRRYRVPELPSVVVLHGRPSWPSPSPRPLQEPLKLFYPTSAIWHKNIRLLAGMVREATSRKMDVRLTVTVSETQEFESRPVVELFEDHRSCVDLIGPVGRDDLPSLYEAHDVLVFPSLFEAFGLPLIEAMVMNMPIIASDKDWAREVCGPAAIYRDPHDPEAWVGALEEIRAAGQRANTPGLERATQFDWDAAVQQYAILLDPSSA